MNGQMGQSLGKGLNPLEFDGIRMEAGSDQPRPGGPLAASPE